MIRNFVLVGFVILAIHLTGVESVDIYNPLVQAIGAHQSSILAVALLGSLLVVGISFFFSQAGMFNTMFGVAKIFYELSQVAICAVCFLSLWFCFDIGTNLWTDVGATLFMSLFPVLAASALSLRMFDFNYPVKDTIFSYIVLSVVTMIGIWGALMVI